MATLSDVTERGGPVYLMTLACPIIFSQYQTEPTPFVDNGRLMSMASSSDVMARCGFSDDVRVLTVIYTRPEHLLILISMTTLSDVTTERRLI